MILTTMITIGIWTGLFCLSLGYFFWQCWGRLQLLLKGTNDDLRDYSLKTLWPRTKNTLIYAFGQKKFLIGKPGAEQLHVLVFWGFMVLLIQVIRMFVRGWIPDFEVPFFSINGLGGPYAFAKDFFQALVILGVLTALYRWGVSKPQRLMGFLPAEEKLHSQNHWEAFLILFFILAIMLSGYFYDASRISLYRDVIEIELESIWQPFSLLLSHLFDSSPESASRAMQISWWVHNIVILVFINLLPRSKHFHIITSIPNVFFGKVEPFGKLRTPNYEKEGTLFGRSQPQHFTKKQILDMFSCTECGRCSSVCPATSTKKPLAPRQFLVNLRDSLYSNQSALIKAAVGSNQEFETVVGEGKSILDEVIWSCVSCRACEEQCPVNIEYVDKIIDIRQHLVQEAARFPEELNRTFKGLETNSNPWGISREERAAWATGLNVPTIDEKPGVEYLYYVGCGGSFDSNNKRTTQNFVKILNSANVSYAILGKNESCNGETARRLGNEYLFQSMAQELAAKINATGVKKILTNCPHCFNTLKNEYPDFGGQWEVIRAADFVAQLLSEQKIKLSGELKKNIVYHDSCYYGRQNNIYEEQRNVLKAIPGTTLTEMEASRRDSTCCGAGGGRMWLEEEKDKRVNIMRTEQALEKKPDIIATSCPYCKIMIASAVNEKGVNDKVQVLDVMEMVGDSLQT